MIFLKSIQVLVFVIAILFTCSFLTINDSPVVKTACATSWGACNPDPNYQSCPSGIGPISGCISSVDFNVTINSVGSAPVPNNTPFRIQIYPSDGSGNSCSNVTCLKRTTDYTTPGWGSAGIPYQVKLDQIGCDLTGSCTNNFTVQINFATTVTGLNCPEYRQNFNIQNGSPVTVTYNINCTSTQTYTCTTTATQMCMQQSDTATHCLAGWSPDPAAKTCPQDTSGIPNVCCVQDACIQMPAPQPTVTCSGCTN